MNACLHTAELRSAFASSFSNGQPVLDGGRAWCAHHAGFERALAREATLRQKWRLEHLEVAMASLGLANGELEDGLGQDVLVESRHAVDSKVMQHTDTCGVTFEALWSFPASSNILRLGQVCGLARPQSWPPFLRHICDDWGHRDYPMCGLRAPEVASGGFGQWLDELLHCGAHASSPTRSGSSLWRT